MPTTTKSTKSPKTTTPKEIKVNNTDIEIQLKSFIYAYNGKEDILVAQIRSLDKDDKLVTTYDAKISKLRHPQEEIVEGLNKARNFFFFSDKYKDEVKQKGLELRLADTTKLSKEKQREIEYFKFADGYKENKKSIEIGKEKVKSKE